MSRLYDGFKNQSAESTSWYLQIAGQGDQKMVYGPISLLTMCDWATQGRVMAGNHISTDGANWFAAEELPDLKMDWVVELKNGAKLGPFNLLAAPFLLQRGIIQDDAVLLNPETNKQVAIKSLMREDGDQKSQLSGTHRGSKGLVSAAADFAAKEKPATAIPPKTTAVKAAATAIPDSELSKLVADLSEQVQERGTELNSVKKQLEAQKSAFDEAAHNAKEKERSLLKRIADLEKGSRKQPGAIDDLRRQLAVEQERHLQEKTRFETNVDTKESEKTKALQAAEKKLQQIESEREQLTKHITSVEEQAQARRNEFEANERQLVDRINSMEEAIAGMHGRIEDTKEQLSSVARERDEATASTASMESKLSSAEKRAAVSDQLEADNAALTALKADTEKALKAAQTELAATSKQLDASEAVKLHVADLEDSLKTLSSEKSDLAGKLAQTRKQLESAEAAKAQVIELQKSLDATSAEKGAVSSQLEQMRTQLSAKLEAAQKKAETAEPLEAKNTELLVRIEVLEGELKDARGSLASTAVELDESKAVASRAADLERSLKELSAEKTGLAGKLAETEKTQADKIAKQRNDSELAQKDLAAARKKLELLQARNDEHRDMSASEAKTLTRSISQLEKKVTGYEARGEKLLAAKAQLQKESQIAAKASAKEQRALLSRIKALEKVSASTEELKKELASQRKRNIQLKKTNEELKQKVSLLQDDANAATGMLEKAKHDIDVSRSTAQKAVSEAENLAASMQTAAREMSTLKKQLASSTNEIDELASQLESANAGATELRSAVSEAADLAVTIETLETDLESALTETGKVREAASNDLKALEEKHSAEVESLAKQIQPTEWRFKVDENVYGPVSLNELKDWVEQLRISPEHLISSDNQNWKPAKDLPELRMEWMITLDDGESFGPANIFSLPYLVQDGLAAPKSEITNIKTKEKTTLGDKLLGGSLADDNALKAANTRIAELEKRIEELEKAPTPAPAVRKSTPAPPPNALKSKLASLKAKNPK